MKNANLKLLGTQEKSLFPLKDKADHFSCVIYREDRCCDQNYIGETVRNAKIRLNEHEDKKYYLSIKVRTQSINVHGPSSASLLRTFISAEF